MNLRSLFRFRQPLRDLARCAAALEDIARSLRVHWRTGPRRKGSPTTEIASLDYAAIREADRKRQEEMGMEVEDE
jgi:hypothetical protein